MDDPTTWAFLWLVVAAVFGIGEMLMAGSFFMLPFAVGGVLASFASFAGVPVAGGWLIFVVASILAFLALKPLAARLDLDLPNPVGTGANRLVGDVGVVSDEIPGSSAGQGIVRIGGEDWRAETRNVGRLLPGTPVRIIAVEGTRVIVESTTLF